MPFTEKSASDKTKSDKMGDQDKEIGLCRNTLTERDHVVY
jgi:hypothetical protein